MIFDEKVTTNCKITKTPILCSCHNKPMKYPKRKIDNFIKEHGQSIYCDVCKTIDKTWAEGTLDLMNKDQRNIPNLPLIVARTIAYVHWDYFHNRWFYKSICEDKLKTFTEKEPVDPSTYDLLPGDRGRV